MPKKRTKDNGHKRLSPSKAKRWMNCSGSVALSEQVPKPETSVYAAEGTAAHTLAERCLNNEKEAKHYLGQVIKVEGFKFEVDEEMAEAVQVYLDVIEEDWNKSGKNADYHVEYPCNMESIHPDLGGTSDFVLDDYPRKLSVYDYKHGKGVDVDVDENPQGLSYALGYAHSIGKQYKEYEIIVVQPRLDDEERHVKRWSFKPGRLNKFKKETLEAVQRVYSDDPTFAEGDWCKFCPGAGICPQLHNHALTVAQADFTPAAALDMTAPTDLTPPQLLLVLHNAKIISDWLKSVESHAFGMLKAGEEIEGFKLVRGRANRKWKKDPIPKLRKKGFKLKDITETKPLSPAQMIKAIGEDDCKGLWEKPEGKLAIASDSDKRIAAPLPAQLDFDVYED